MVIDIVGFGAVFRAQPNGCGAPAEPSRPSWRGADLFGIGRPADVEIRAPDQLKEGPIHRCRQPKRDASRVRKTHFLGIDRRMLCLLGVGTLQFVAGRARIPEVAAKERALCCIVFEYREIWRVGISLCRPLAGPKVKRPGIRDHRQIDRRYRPAESRIWHMAERAGFVPEGRHIFVEIHQLAEYVYRLISAAPQYRWITCQSRMRQLSPFVKRFIEDELDFAPNPCDLRIQIGRQDAGWIGIVGSGLAYLGLSRRGMRNADEPEHRC